MSRRIVTIPAETRDEIASSVQLGLMLPRTTRATSIFIPINTRLGEARAGRLFRSWRVLRNRSLALPLSFVGGARAGSDGCPVDRRRSASPGTPSRRSPRPSSRRLRRPSSPPATAPIAGNSREFGKFLVFPGRRGLGRVKAQEGRGAFALARSRAARRRCRRWLRPDLRQARSGAQALQPTAYKGHLDPRPRLGRFGFHELELDTFK